MRKRIPSVLVAALTLTLSLATISPALAEDSTPETQLTTEVAPIPENGDEESDSNTEALTPIRDTKTPWFNEEPAPFKLEEVVEAAEEAAPENSIQERIVSLDTTSALTSLVSSETLLGAVPGERIIVDAQQNELALKLFGDESDIIEIEEVAITLPADNDLPTVEVLGVKAEDGAALASASFVFLPDDTGSFVLTGGIQEPGEPDVVVQEVAEDVYRIDQVPSLDAVPDEHLADILPKQPSAPSLSPDFPIAAAPASGITTVDLVVGFANGTGTLSAMRADTNIRVAQTNQALAHSQAKARIGLVGTMAVPYTQTGSFDTDLDNFYSKLNGTRSLMGYRDSTGADLAALIVPNATDACGIGYLPDATGKRPDMSLTVTSKSCLNGYTLTHEIGHNLGANHDPDTIKRSGEKPYPYAYSQGIAIPGVARDVMGYDCTPDCPKLLQFSNPKVPLIGFPSIPSGVANKQDNVRSIDEQVSRVASYRRTKIAKDVPKTHRFYTEITWLVNRGITTGYADDTFRPSEDLARDAMAAFLYRMDGKPAFTPPATSPFKDVPKTHKFYKEITWMKAKGITSGYADGTFKPLENVSRDAMSAFLYRFNGKPAFTPPATSPFKDVPKTHKFYKEITWMKAKGISTGNADGTFAPNNAVTREAMAAFLYRYDQKLG